MANYLKMPKKQQVLALLDLGWSYRRIETETGIRRETVSRYAARRRANAAKTSPGSSSTPDTTSPATAGESPSNAAKTFAGSRHAAAIYHDTICEKRDAGLSVQRIWQDLVEEFGYGASYEPCSGESKTGADWPLVDSCLRSHCTPCRSDASVRTK
jgi:hypothetical protein